MSKYTVQLRYLVEQFAADHGANGMDPANWHLAYPMLGLSGNVNTLNLPPYPALSEEDRSRINRKLIQRYWFNEIGLETAGQFAWYLNEAMNRIMPYYNSLYQAKIDTLEKLLGERWGVDRLTKLASSAVSNDNGVVDGRNHSTSNGLSRTLDTPEARIENLDDGYLTSATRGNDETDATSHVSDTRDSTSKRDDSGTFGETGRRLSPQYLHIALGIGRELLNIDDMLVNDMELRDCFMHVW